MRPDEVVEMGADDEEVMRGDDRTIQLVVRQPGSTG